MRIIFLIETLDNRTAANIVAAFEATDHHVDVIAYYSQGQNQCVIGHKFGAPFIVYKDQRYYARDYDAALLWSWGTADLGRQYLRLFEDQGIAIVNSSYMTELTDSKIHISRLFQKANIPIPPTLYFNTAINMTEIQVQEALGSPPYVFKADYGTQGNAIRFANSYRDLIGFADKLVQRSNNKRFIVQRFVGDASQPISHYRVLVLGKTTLPFALKITANEPLKVSNIAKGSNVTLVPLEAAMGRLAIDATKNAGLKIAGVDIMVGIAEKQQRMVVLEVNDGPGTKTFDAFGCGASEAVVDYFLATVSNDIRGEERIRC